VLCPPIDLAAHHPFGILHRDPALPLRDVDDECHHQHGHDAHEDPVAGVEVEQHTQTVRKARDDAREDHQRDTVADAPLGDEFAEPHDERGTDRQTQDHQEEAQWGESAHADERVVLLVEQEHEADRLDEGQHHGEVPGVLVDLLASGLALFRQRFQSRDHHGEKLHDDRRGDVGHDAQSKDSNALQPAPGEQVVEVEDAARGRVERVRHGLRVDTRHRDVAAQPVDRDDHGREEQLLPEIGKPPGVEQ
jgi:hypothetical protein